MPRQLGEGHDLVVIGASAGGVETLATLVKALPADLRAAVLVCLHIAPGTSVLPRILTRAGAMPAAHPHEGEVIEAGRIYCAPPDHHLLVADGSLRLVRGPVVNRVRPAIDPLLESAARHYGPRVIGVVLSGMLDDGTAGLRAVKARGGVAVVQDPDDALFPGMPTSALTFADPDHVVPLSAMASLLEELVNTPPSSESGPEEGTQPAGATGDPTVPHPGEPVDFSCPECSGTLRLVEGEFGMVSYRCRVGHVFSPESLLVGQSEQLEHALWAAVASLGEQADLSRRMARRMRERGLEANAERYDEMAARAVDNAQIVQSVATGMEHARIHEVPFAGGADR